MTATQLNSTAHQVSSALTSSASAKASVASQSGSGSDITSNDFLSLLVSELKNQDPTQPTDPNAYVQQLVGVNSLQQLININQGLTKIEDVSSSANISGPQQI